MTEFLANRFHKRLSKARGISHFSSPGLAIVKASSAYSILFSQREVAFPLLCLQALIQGAGSFSYIQMLLKQVILLITLD